MNNYGSGFIPILIYSSIEAEIIPIVPNGMNFLDASPMLFLDGTNMEFLGS
jgi:hypothetical protein